MTAREQAQEACYQRRLQVSQGAKLTTAPEDYADLASDVWEPLLRDLVRAIEAEGPEHAWDPPLTSSAEALRRAKEALDAPVGVVKDS